MAIRVVVAGVTGWTGSAVARAILGGGEFVLAGAVARDAAGKDAGEALGLERAGVTVSATLAEALAAPSDVVVDYTKPNAVKGHALEALKAGRPGSGPPTVARSTRRRAPPARVSSRRAISR